MRVITKHNEAPVPNAGGPYAGNEGSAGGAHRQRDRSRTATR